MFSAPTVIAYGELPGESIPPSTSFPSSVLPVFPAAATTTSPFATARFTAWQSGSSSADSNTGWPSDRLTIRMLNFFRFATAQSIASMTSLTVPSPFASSTLRLTMCAPGATPP